MPKRANPEIEYGNGGFDHFTNTNVITGQVTYPSLSAGGYYDLYRAYTSVDTPNFRGIPKKQLPDHPYNVDMKKFKSTPAYVKVYRRHWTQTSMGLWQHDTYSHAFPARPWMPVTAHDGEAMTVAQNKLRKKAAGVKANLAQLFAERRKTAMMLASTVSRVAQAARALKQGRLGDFVNALQLAGKPTFRWRTGTGHLERDWKRAMKTPPEQRLAGHWLEFKYGWKPLLQDAAGSAELLAYHVNSDGYHDHLSASFERETEISDFEVDFDGTFTSYPVAKYVHNRKTRARIKARYRLTNPAKVALAQTGITNPALLAWELVPFSFVVDWFLPVGDYLERITSFDGFEYIGGTRSFRTIVEFEKSLVNTPEYAEDQYGSHMKMKVQNGSWECKHLVYTRELVYSWPDNPFPELRSPIGNNAKDRFATALALLQQVFGRK